MFLFWAIVGKMGLDDKGGYRQQDLRARFMKKWVQMTFIFITEMVWISACTWQQPKLGQGRQGR